MSEVIIALDFPNLAAVESFLKLFEGESLFVKVGMELYYQEGPEIVKYLKEKGHKVFLDLKLHDIPNTVERSMRGLAKMGVDMTNVHASGGVAMMEAARRGLGPDTLLIAVTQLTSTSEEAMQFEQKVEASLKESVCHYAKLAQSAGLDGVVCSPLEARMIHENTDTSFLCVTPGVRPKDAEKGDQQRVMTPSQARLEGANYIVVGRPITQALDPLAAYQTIVKEWEQNI